MKKLLSLVCLLVLGSVLFAQNASKKLLAGVYNFATEASDDWRIVNPLFSKINPINDEYVFDGSFIVKIRIGYMRYDFTCSIAQEADDFSVKLENVHSYGCNKDGIKPDSGKVYNTTTKVAAEYAQQMKTEIQKRMNNWSDEEYSKMLDTALTSPLVLNFVAGNSALVFKKFLADYEIIGKEISLKINVFSVDEAPYYAKGFDYYLGGKAVCGYKTSNLGVTVPETVSVMVFTNSDKVLEVTPADTMDATIGKVKDSAVYEVKGKITDVVRKETSGLNMIKIEE